MKGVAVASFSIAMVLLLSFDQQKKPSAQNDKGKELYNKYCLSCHQANGAGVPRINPSLVRSPYVLGSKTRLIKIILLGSEALTDDPNRRYINPMAPIPSLTNQEMADVLTYVRKNFGNKGTAVTVGDVKYVKSRM
jgi:mono/diheme cytochrome c family protein